MGIFHQVIRRHLRDGGIRSRKLWFGVGTSMAIMGMCFLAAFKPVFIPVLEIAIGGLLGSYGIFCGANVGGKFTIGQAVAKLQAPAPAPAPVTTKSSAAAAAPVEQVPE